MNGLYYRIRVEPSRISDPKSLILKDYGQLLSERGRFYPQWSLLGLREKSDEEYVPWKKLREKLIGGNVVSGYLVERHYGEVTTRGELAHISPPTALLTDVEQRGGHWTWKGRRISQKLVKTIISKAEWQWSFFDWAKDQLDLDLVQVYHAASKVAVLYFPLDKELQILGKRNTAWETKTFIRDVRKVASCTITDEAVALVLDCRCGPSQRVIVYDLNSGRWDRLSQETGSLLK